MRPALIALALAASIAAFPARAAPQAGEPRALVGA